MKDRYQRLHALQQKISEEINDADIGKSFELLVHDDQDARTPDFRLVHIPTGSARPGDFVTARITSAAPNFMVADQIISTRPSRGGDAFAARIAEIGPQPIMMGMPTLKVLKEKKAQGRQIS